MPRALRIAAALTLAGLCARVAAQGDPDAAVASVRTFIAAHCAACHAGDEPEAGLDLRALAAIDPGRWRDDAADWRDALEAVAGLRMPPRDAEPLPDQAARDAFAGAARGVLQRRRPGEPRDPGRPLLRRLNRTEWGNGLTALLGVPVDAARELPEDPSGYGFDTVGDVLFSTPMLVERCWDATVDAVDRFLATPTAVERFAAPGPEDGDDRQRADRRRLRGLLRAAFRRPPTPAEIDDRAALLARAGDPTAGWRQALLATLLSPHFLYRVERDRPERGTAPWPIDDFELAARLSFFLWSSLPDAELAALADAGRLRDGTVLRGQVRRMLADPRARALGDGFGAQWLGFRALRDVAVDVRRFGGFHDGLRRSMYEQAVATVLAVLREERSVLDLVSSDRAFLDATLARHYGIAGIDGDELREIALPDRRRGGVLGLGGVLTVTSYPLRTSPVVRGKWILENLLGTPPPPPPPNAGRLPADDQLDDGLSLRERLLQHRREPRCAACHAQMDALGLALENFDGIGRWREDSQGRAIDANVTLPDGTELDGVGGLTDWLLDQRERIVRNLAEKLLVYALGRPLDFADGEAVDAIVAAARHGDTWHGSALVEAVALSFPFRHRRNPRD
ncbi:MAG: DUF1592 domain-containing protein [Planctomycetes bacterium]|nr:DUF1592 domain-containing protein [Planctomycetota bacterium]